MYRRSIVFVLFFLAISSYSFQPTPVRALVGFDWGEVGKAQQQQQQADDFYGKIQGNTPGTPGSNTPGVSGYSPAPKGGIAIPAGCKATGKCSLEDIIQTGVSFATFLMGLSGALFFMVFLYGGGCYLLSFGDASVAKKGQKAIEGAVIGIIFVMGAWTIVRYVAGTIARPGYFQQAPAGTAAPAKAKPAATPAAPAVAPAK